MSGELLELEVLVPERVRLEARARKVVAEGREGSFGLLPRHVDYAAALVPGIVSFVDADGQERFLATAEGILVKRGRRVRVSVRGAVEGGELGELERAVRRRFRVRDERERSARRAAERLEADVVRRLVELREQGTGGLG